MDYVVIDNEATTAGTHTLKVFGILNYDGAVTKEWTIAKKNITKPSLWVAIADPSEEWPTWAQPIGATDAYMNGDKVSYNDKHYISTVDNNVWEPGVYGWEEA